MLEQVMFEHLKQLQQKVKRKQPKNQAHPWESLLLLGKFLKLSDTQIIDTLKTTFTAEDLSKMLHFTKQGTYLLIRLETTKAEVQNDILNKGVSWLVNTINSPYYIPTAYPDYKRVKSTLSNDPRYRRHIYKSVKFDALLLNITREQL